MIKTVQPGNFYMGRCAHGSDLLDELTAYCEKENITCGKLEAIGAVQKARFGYYDQNNREYRYTEINSHMEILTCIGNISLNEDKAMVHAHITLSDDNGNACGGHLAQGTVVFAAEFTIQAFDNTTHIRDYDETTGLRLWKEE